MRNNLVGQVTRMTYYTDIILNEKFHTRFTPAVSYNGRQDSARHYPNLPLRRCPRVLIHCTSVNIRFILTILEEVGGNLFLRLQLKRVDRKRLVKFVISNNIRYYSTA
jgi:hypothetical protein